MSGQLERWEVVVGHLHNEADVDTETGKVVRTMPRGFRRQAKTLLALQEFALKHGGTARLLRRLSPRKRGG